MIKMTESNETNQSAPASRPLSGDRRGNNIIDGLESFSFTQDLYEFTGDELEKELQFWTSVRDRMRHLNLQENQKTESHEETYEGIREGPVRDSIRTEPSVSIGAETLGVNEDPKETMKLQLNGEEGTLTSMGTEGDYLWTSRNGACKKIRTSCACHRERQVPTSFCFHASKDRCFECSSPIMLAEPFEVCMGNHQWKPETMEEAETQ